jgi:hypothetical protein
MEVVVIDQDATSFSIIWIFSLIFRYQGKGLMSGKSTVC